MRTLNPQTTTLNKNARQSSKNIDAFTCLTPLPSTWVKLSEPPQASSYDEALLMCQYPDGHWSAWIPDLGEVKLNPAQFCRIL